MAVNLRLLLIASGLASILFGLPFVLQTDQAIANFQLGESSVPARLFGRSEGAALIAVGLMNILASGDRPSTALLAIVIANLLLHIAGIGVDFTETFPKAGGWWVGFFMHVIFIVGFGRALLSWNARL